VWKDHVIDRVFSLCDVRESCYYNRFIENICGNDTSRVESMQSTIGFLMHGYKNLSFLPCGHLER
jgi:hypothetical protein